MKNIITFTGIITISLLIGGISHADERIDLINEGKKLVTAPSPSYILESSWETADPFGEFDSSLGAAGALNRALGLVFPGHASHSQIQMQQRMALEPGDSSYKMAPFALEVLDVLQTDWEESLPEPVELKPFDLQPSEIPELLTGDPNILALRYFDEEYLERLLQRLYFKLIQGPVLLTVPYQADAHNVPDEYRDWNNFRYDNNTDTMVWDDTRYVWVDWDLTQTVVLMYEDGRIACYDSGRKYYIDHTAAITAAGAMLAHPDYDELPEGTSLSFVLAMVE